MLILSIDSATESATCAVLDEDRLLGEVTFNYKKQHSVILMPIVDNLLKGLNLTVKDIDGYVVSKGPGSFTGLRIGMSVVKGLSQGSGKPFVSISTLDALAFNLSYTSGIICPILDALRDNVYTALFVSENGKLKRISEYMALSIDELIEILREKNQPVSFIGDAVPKFKDKLKSSLENSLFAPVHLNFARSSSLGELGLELLKAGSYDDIYTSAPIYLRKSQAEREYDKKMGIDTNE